MALTRVTSTVIENSAVSADKLGNSSITSVMIAAGSISADKLAANVATDGPSSGQIARVNTNLVANVNSVKANVDAAEANVAAIKDNTTDLNIGAARYFFDKSRASLGLSNGNPVATSLTMGTPGNVIINFGSDAGNGNVIVGTPDPTTAFRLDVRGTANTGPLTADNVELTHVTSVIIPSDGRIGIPGAVDAIKISSGGIVTFKDDIKIKDGGTIGTATDPAAITIAAAGGVTFSDRSTHSGGITVADGGQIGSATTAAAITVASDGIVTFADDIKIKNDGTIGSAGAATAMSIDSSGIVTFVDDIKIKDGGTIGSATTAAAVTIAADGLVTIGDDLSVTGNLTVLGDTTTVNTENLVIQDNFMALANSQPFDSATSLDSGIFFNRGSAGNAALYYDQSATGFRLSETRDPFANAAISPTHDANLTLSNLFAQTIQVPNDGKIGSAGSTSALTISSDGAVTLADDLAVTGNATVTLGLGVSGNTAPEGGPFGGISLGTPANVVIRTGGSTKAGNVIIGDATATSGFNLDVRGTANTGALTSTTVTVSGLTASRALQTDGSKGLESSAVTTTELGRLSGVTGDIQTQLDAKIATTASASNDFVTFTRLNANVNAVMANVDEKSGTANANAAALASGIATITDGGTLLTLHDNSNVQAAGSTANTFFIGVPMPGDGLANIISVSLDGVVQQKDVPSGAQAANNDFIMNAVAAHASIKFTAPSIPVGSTVIITALKA